MYDKELKQGLLEFKVGSDNIFDLEERYKNIDKIIINRTKEKLEIVRYLHNHDNVDAKICQELYRRIKYDYKFAILFTKGIITNLE